MTLTVPATYPPSSPSHLPLPPPPPVQATYPPPPTPSSPSQLLPLQSHQRPPSSPSHLPPSSLQDEHILASHRFSYLNPSFCREDEVRMKHPPLQGAGSTHLHIWSRHCPQLEQSWSDGFQHAYRLTSKRGTHTCLLQVAETSDCHCIISASNTGLRGTGTVATGAT